MESKRIMQSAWVTTLFANAIVLAKSLYLEDPTLEIFFSATFVFISLYEVLELFEKKGDEVSR